MNPALVPAFRSQTHIGVLAGQALAHLKVTAAWCSGVVDGLHVTALAQISHSCHSLKHIDEKVPK
jgi:hypothetical protein